MGEFWIGLIIGYLLGTIICFIVECMCIVAGKSDKDKWMEENKDEGN